MDFRPSWARCSIEVMQIDSGVWNIHSSVGTERPYLLLCLIFGLVIFATNITHEFL